MQKLVLLFCCIPLAGCYLNPYENPGDWSMTGASNRDLAAQVADPGDLIAGKSDNMTNGVAATAGVDAAIGGASGSGKGLLTPPANSTPAISITGS